jgi:hypothetical protein
MSSCDDMCLQLVNVPLLCRVRSLTYHHSSTRAGLCPHRVPDVMHMSM